MSRLAFFHPADNVAGTGSWSIASGTEDSAYPLANLYDLNPAKPMKFTTPTGRLVIDWTNPQRIDAVMIPHHNLLASLEVRWQMHTANLWTAPDVNQIISIPAWDEDGFPPSVWLDLATLVPTAADRTRRYGSLVVVGTNNAAVAIGELLLWQLKKELAPADVSYPFGMREIRRRLLHETEYGVRTRYDYGAKIREITTQCKTTDAGFQQLRSWARACKVGTLPTAIVPKQGENLALMVEWDTDAFQHDEEMLDNVSIPLKWRELSRGLPL